MSIPNTKKGEGKRQEWHRLLSADVFIQRKPQKRQNMGMMKIPTPL